MAAVGAPCNVSRLLLSVVYRFPLFYAMLLAQVRAGRPRPTGQRGALPAVAAAAAVAESRPPPESACRSDGRASGQRSVSLSFRDCLRKGRKRGGMFSRRCAGSFRRPSPSSSPRPRPFALEFRSDIAELFCTMARLIVPDAERRSKDDGGLDLESQKMLQSDSDLK